jgi:hypothetical protein
MKIAYCNAIRQFQGNRLAERAWSSRFPGTSWVSVLHEWSSDGRFEIASGDVALDRVRSGEWRAEDVRVLQELDSPHGHDLCRLGAKPTLLMSLESPLVAFRNFDRLRREVAPFENVMGPSMLLEDSATVRGAKRHALSFPCYWASEPPSQVTARRQPGIVLVAANKYWKERGVGGWRDPGGTLRLLRRALRRRLSPTFRACRPAQLHDERLAIIERLAQQGLLDVWGSGWDSLENLPSQWRERISRSGLRRHGPCPQKSAVLVGFEYALACENAACAGYVTEKIFDAMHAGCIPIYRGAPDIQRHVPAEAFIDGRGLAEADDPDAWLRERVEHRADAMRAAARAFLASPAGLRHSFEGFASWMLELCGPPGVGRS